MKDVLTPEEYKLVKELQDVVIDRSRDIIDEAREAAERCPMPKNLRPATGDDIVEGAIIWYKGGSIPCWNIVDEVLGPNDDWKVYMSDGCRLGLDNAFVEVRED